jgi:hypothetical protein
LTRTAATRCSPSATSIWYVARTASCVASGRQRPLLWAAYRQTEAAHLVKVEGLAGALSMPPAWAALTRWLNGAPGQAGPLWQAALAEWETAPQPRAGLARADARAAPPRAGARGLRPALRCAVEPRHAVRSPVYHLPAAAVAGTNLDPHT